MDPLSPLIAPLITGGSGLLGNIFSSLQSGQNTQNQMMNQQMMLGEQNAFNTQAAQNAEYYNQTNLGLAENYNSQMSNTAYQRASNDMKAAGLNPAMMFTHGAAESSPSVGAPGGPQASGSIPSAPMPSTTSALSGLGGVVSSALSSLNQMQDFQKNLHQTEYEKQKALDMANQASKSGLSLPQARLDAKEAEEKLNLPAEDIRSHAVSPYIGATFGHWGSEIATPAKTVIDNLGRGVSDLVSDITGPTGQSMWKRARDAAANLPKYVGPGGSVLDFKDFPNIRKTTANPDFGDSYR